MKRILAILISIFSLVLVLTMTSCQNSNDGENTTDATSAETTAAQNTEPNVTPDVTTVVTKDTEAVTSEETTAPETTAEETTEPPVVAELPYLKLADYSVFCPDNALAWERNAAADVAVKLSSLTGTEIKVTTEHSENEVLVGRFCLDEEFLTADYGLIGYNGYSIFASGKKIVITAKTDHGFDAAVAGLDAAVTVEDGNAALAKDFKVLKQEEINTVTPDENMFLDVVIEGDTGYDVYTVPAVLGGGYRYGPSIMVHEDGSMDAWFASSGGGPQWDWITWKHSEDGETWSDEKVVLQPTPDGLDHYSCCDPGVIYFGGYYYLGYTSTVNSNQCDNYVFVARSENPDGPFVKWNGSGWGGNKPQPIVVFDESTKKWGSGEPSFVEVNGTLYIYYTWNGSDGHVTYVATADATDPNWPATMVRRGVAVPSGSNDSIDVKYVEKFGKFIAIATDQRMGPNSYLVFFQSNDGITFTKTDICKENVYFYCHNSGISGSENGHIVEGRRQLVGYAYGEGWGIWNTRFQDISIELTDTVDLSETNGPNISAESARDPRDPATLPISGITCLSKDVYSYSITKASFSVVLYSCNAFHNSWTPISGGETLKDITYSGYDENVVQCTNGSRKINIVGVGQTVVTATWRGFVTSFSVRIIDSGKTTEVVSIEPYAKDSFIIDRDSGSAYTPQLKVIMRYSDFSWVEAFGDDMVEYSGYNEQIIRIDFAGRVIPLGVGTTEVTVSSNGCSCTLTVRVDGKEDPYDYANIEFETGDKALLLMKSTNNATATIENGVLVCTPSPASDPFINISYGTAELNTGDYKSLTLTYMIPTGLSHNSFTGQMFFMCGSDNDPAENRSQKYPMTADGEWHTVTLELSDKSYWNGVINSVRFDFFDSCSDGDVLYVKAITLNQK